MTDPTLVGQHGHDQSGGQVSLFDAPAVAAPATDDLERMAVISRCERYRYALMRAWSDGPRRVMFVGLNPSTADGMVEDPTLRRCIGFARAWGYDGLWMANLYGLRSPKPRALRLVDDPIGPTTDHWLAHMRERSDLVVACWGADPMATPERVAAVRAIVGDELHAIRVTKTRRPEHPLYLPGELRPIPYHQEDVAMSDTNHPRPPRPRKHRPGSTAFDTALLAKIKAEPGLTIPVLADAMECAQNQLYRVLPRLHKAGQVVRHGRGWHLAPEAEDARDAA
jgi:hypothetical protein